ncbi:DUF6011 domain-containing protein [Cohnella kolymensis]|uniref:DUF6011 domain-containing protein n=1 Tax=Cohnella kolymensis TaxID=1590652 RepID=UPI003898DF47
MEQTKQPLYNKCFACRRRLKDPESKRTGLGPICRKKYEKKRIQKVVQLELFDF